MATERRVDLIDRKVAMEVVENIEMKLKPCPFCGSTPVLVSHSKFFSVECTNDDCSCLPSTWEFLFEEKAIETWNRRADNGI